jgi:tyrosinase
MGIRQNYRDLGDTERGEFIEALLELKRRAVYDELVQLHVDGMAHSTPQVGPGITGVRNAAHRGPAFLPWHREYLLRFERALQSVNDRVNLPYWDWTEDAADPGASPIWDADFMGGEGDEDEGWRVMTGPFARDNGDWIITVEADQHGDALRRRFGRLDWPLPDGGADGTDYTLPTTDDVDVAMKERHYDAYPYNDSSFTTGFRNRLEGWITQLADPAVPLPGTQLHNRVHVFVGGAWIETDSNGQRSMALGSMLPASSPNDPIFFLHHCYIDKLWANWQRERMVADPNGRPHYAPIVGGPFGHNLNDPMFPWRGSRTPLAVLNHQALGYSYDTDAERKEEVAAAIAAHALPEAAPPLESPFL